MCVKRKEMIKIILETVDQKDYTIEKLEDVISEQDIKYYFSSQNSFEDLVDSQRTYKLIEKKDGGTLQLTEIGRKTLSR